MNIGAYKNYRKKAVLWMRICLIALPICIVIVSVNSEGEENRLVFTIALIISIFSGIGLMIAWMMKHYYTFYEKAVANFEKQPELISWKIDGAVWNDYSLMELQHRKRGYLTFLWWSPVILAFIAYSLFTQIDEIPFDINLLWYSLAAYALVIALVYFQIKKGSIKKSDKPKTQHTIVLKNGGALIDDEVAFWGKVMEDKHKTLKESLLAALFIFGDKERGIVSSKLVQQNRYSYFLITYKVDDNNQRELYLPVPDDRIQEAQSHLGNADKPYVAPLPSNNAAKVESDGKKKEGKKGFNTSFYVGVVSFLFAIGAFLFSLIDVSDSYDKDKAQDYFNDGVDMAAQKNYDSAMHLYKKAVNEFPDFPEAYLNIGVFFYNQQKPDSTLHYYNLALQYKPDYDLALLNKAIQLEELKKYAESNSAYLAHYQLQPEDRTYDLDLGDNYFMLDKFDSALFYYNRSYTDNKRSANLCYMIGLAYYQKKEWDKALAPFQESLKLDSTLTDAYEMLGKTNEVLGNQEEAKKWYGQAEQLKNKDSK
jgi:tetratricopeptide (TPR) repeat protein